MKPTTTPNKIAIITLVGIISEPIPSPINPIVLVTKYNIDALAYNIMKSFNSFTMFASIVSFYILRQAFIYKYLV